MALKRGAVKLAWTPFGGGNNSGVTVLVPLYYFSVSVVLGFLIFECCVLEWDVVSWSVDVDVAEAGRRCQQQTTKLCFSHSVCHHGHQLPLWNEWRWRGRWLKQFDGRRQHQRQRPSCPCQGTTSPPPWLCWPRQGQPGVEKVMKKSWQLVRSSMIFTSERCQPWLSNSEASAAILWKRIWFVNNLCNLCTFK